MAQESLRATQKVRLVNLETLEEFVAQFNPPEFAHASSVEYTRHAVVGLSYQPHQYGHTTNREFTVTFQFKVERPSDKREYESSVNLLMALQHPLEPGGSPPDVLFVWPNLASFPVKVLAVSSRHVQFNAELAPTRTDVDVMMMRIRDRPLLYGEVRERGMME